MSKRGLPTGIKMRHDAHYVEELAQANRAIGRMLDIEKVFPNPDQPRREFGDLDELTASIREQGVLEPLLVQPGDDRWMIIAGERRWRASKAAGLTEIPVIELDIDDKTVAEIALVENLQRKDLNIWEIADGLADLARQFGYTHDEIAQKIGKSRSTVTESLAIANLPDAVRTKCREKGISAKSTLIEISREFDEASMLSLLERVSDEDGNVIREAVRSKKQTPSKTPEKTKPTSPAPEKNVFEFRSTEENFVLTIRHDRNKLVTRTDLLKALKEAFDSVKASQ